MKNVFPFFKFLENLLQAIIFYLLLTYFIPTQSTSISSSLKLWQSISGFLLSGCQSFNHLHPSIASSNLEIRAVMRYFYQQNLLSAFSHRSSSFCSAFKDYFRCQSVVPTLKVAIREV